MALGVLGLWGISSAWGQDEGRYDGQSIARVEIVGLRSISEAYVRSAILRTRPGQAYQRDQVEADVRELLRTRKFTNVFADARPEGDQVVVVFTVQEKPLVAEVRIMGNAEFKDEELYELAPTPGQPLDIYEVNRAAEEILRKYREAGYYDAVVELDTAALEAARRVVYRITEGPRVRVREIVFEGAEAFSERKLNSLIQTKTYVMVFRVGAFDAEQADRDAIELERFYRDEGFLDAQVGYRLEFDELERSDLIVVFVIEEGPRYAVDEILVEGATAFDAATILAAMSLAPGAVFRDEALQTDLRRVQALYGEIGYVDVRVVTEYDFLEQPGVVRLRYTIDEGPRSKFGRITVRGNLQTQDKVIRRELRFYPGEDYDVLETRAAERRLRETALFSRATITPLEDHDGAREARVDVEEADAILFLAGVGVSTDSGVLGSVSIENRNFDLFDWPRSPGEFVRGQSFRGAGQRLRLMAEPGTELTRFRISFTEPYFLDRPLRLSTSAYLFQRGRQAYDEQRLGFTVSLGRRFETGPLDGWALEGRVAHGGGRHRQCRSAGSPRNPRSTRRPLADIV